MPAADERDEADETDEADEADEADKTDKTDAGHCGSARSWTCFRGDGCGSDCCLASRIRAVGSLLWILTGFQDTACG
ncbi:hypothetical protein E4U41_000620 [Claviceps citrina]|nr:hypothetical protein E4U41_000620 [Claviceps citrina]